MNDSTDPANEFERQLLWMFRRLSRDSQEKLLAEANERLVAEQPGKSIANPYGECPSGGGA